MNQYFKPDHYNGFKSDVERQRVLNTKVFSSGGGCGIRSV